MASPPLDTPVLSATNIPSSSHSAPVGNVSSILPTSGGTFNVIAVSTMTGFSQFMPSMKTNDKIFIRPTLDYYFLFCFLMDFLIVVDYLINVVFFFS